MGWPGTHGSVRLDLGPDAHPMVGAAALLGLDARPAVVFHADSLRMCLHAGTAMPG